VEGGRGVESGKLFEMGGIEMPADELARRERGCLDVQRGRQCV